MLAFTNADEKKSPTIIGAGCQLKGDIKTDHNVQVHGVITGDIVANTIIIGRGGVVNGNIKTQTLFLHGDLNGDAFVNVANIFANAKMQGTLHYKTLNITGNTGLECKLAKTKDEKNAK
ncbi:MAG: polymer-forming cytoskeletal protein [Alphaproteobacteria bacterium]|nr:polymer-forming cytoskeletal protein [Alphaproteobacteria bacterium]